MLRLSRLFVRTLREDPADAEVPSHRLLVRAGYIRRAAPGGYTWLPLGWRVLRRVEDIVRREMDAIGAQEVHFLCADRVHLATNDVLHPTQHPPAEWQPGVSAGSGAPDVAGPHQEAVARNFRICRVLPESAHEKAGETKHRVKTLVVTAMLGAVL